MEFEGGVARLFEFGNLSGAVEGGMFAWWRWDWFLEAVEVTVKLVESLKVEITFWT